MQKGEKKKKGKMKQSIRPFFSKEGNSLQIYSTKNRKGKL